MIKKLGVFSLLIGALMAAPAWAFPLLAPGDAIIAIDADGIVSNSGYPGAEAPPNILDGNSGTKYLNFAGPGSGFIVTPNVGATMMQSFTLTTANDAPGRDPTTWELFGTNDAITSLDNSTGLAENWTLISSGGVALPDARLTVGPVVSFANSSSYSSYRMVYPELKGSNLMQIADASFYASNDGSGDNLLSTLDAILAIHQGWDSSYPGAESPAMCLDGNANTKYLNFGEENSGLIVTPALGSATIKSFQITTANDSAERDPTSWILYGTNDPITSEENSDGVAENWVEIDSGTVALPDERLTVAPLVGVSNDTAYLSYKIIFPTVKNADGANSMQIADIQFFGIPEPMTICLLGLGGVLIGRRRKH